MLELTLHEHACSCVITILTTQILSNIRSARKKEHKAESDAFRENFPSLQSI